jgi:hypothetical protein
MDKVGALGLIYRDKVDIDATQVAPPINGSYREFSKPFYRSVGIAPDKGTAATTSRINDTIDGSVFDRWRADAFYRPENLWLGRRRSRSIPPRSSAPSGLPTPRSAWSDYYFD